MKIMGLDFGSRTTGVAMTDELMMMAHPAETILRDREMMLRHTLQRIEVLVAENDVRLIIMGLPLNMDGTMSERAKLTEAFADRLRRRLGLPVVLSDERLTTVASNELLDEMNVRGRKEKKRVVDQLAAQMILQEYMNNHPGELADWRAGRFPEV